MSPADRNVVTVHIGGDEYAIRTPAPPEYTRELAGYVDRAVHEVLSKSALLQPHKAAILAALALTDELFQARAELARFRQAVAARSESLAAEAEAGLPPA
ncbi:MAG: cell division protein ZapA [Gemmatimonadetes bacterium]|nr:cell division protein ZapA [Gemmatimonadota bacterium]